MVLPSAAGRVADRYRVPVDILAEGAQGSIVESRPNASAAEPVGGNRADTHIGFETSLRGDPSASRASPRETSRPWPEQWPPSDVCVSFQKAS